MALRPLAPNAPVARAPEAPRGSACAVCGAGDARTLTFRKLAGGDDVVLCGSHALVLERLDRAPATPAELESALGDRRDTSRRGGEAEDELAARLFDAFTTERRGSDRRAAVG